MDRSDFDLDFQNQRIESKIVASLERLSQAFRVLLWEESKEYALSPIQVQVLIFLLHHSSEKRKVSYLAGEFNITKATVSDTVKTLEQKKLIRKETDPDDSRSFVIHLTPSGREIANKTSHFTRQIRIPVAQLSAGDKETLLLSLMDMIRHLNSQGIITIQRMCTTCVHYQQSENGKQHFCKLLNQTLRNQDLRVDCPEHIFYIPA